MQVRYAFGDDVGAVLWESIEQAQDDARQWVTVTSLLVQDQGGLPLNFVVCRGSQLLVLDLVVAGLLETSVYGNYDTSPWLSKRYGRTDMPTLIDDVMKHRVVVVADSNDGETVLVTMGGPRLEALKSGRVCTEVNRVLNSVVGHVQPAVVTPRETDSSFPLPTYTSHEAVVLTVERYRNRVANTLAAFENLSLSEAYDAVNGSIRQPVMWLCRAPHDESKYRVREELRRRAARLDLRIETNDDVIHVE